MPEDPLVSRDFFVTHVSTVPANRGKTVGLFVREKALASTLVAAGTRKPHVVLMVHGGFGPSIVAYDLRYRDYSFMAVLARAGFDVFTMSHTGYGPSPRPLMDDPCNVDAEFQPLLVPHVLKELSAPRYPFKLVSSRTEWDELETVIRHIRKLRGVERVSLVGWSTGAPRAGGFAALHPDEVHKLVLFGPAPWFPGEQPPAQMPEPGAPTLLQTREFLLHRRWQDYVRCEGQLEDAEVCNAYWREIMAVDEVGAGWGPNGEGMIRAPNRMNFGWRANLARIEAPTLVLLGEFDNYARRLEAWKGLTVEHRMFIRIACASHFVSFERGRHLLYRATQEWLARGAVDGAQRGEFLADVEGRLTPSPAQISARQ
ncbi:MAG TPA: alpha/beta fold hydrolase [Burkholderiales bacterium]|nr:alpha/beta fold hydrolase [Burkholderiales bacterium]